MNITSIFLIGLGLAMDAFAVSIAKGMSLNSSTIKEYAFKIAFFFGLFQGIMPMIGYFAGSTFASYIQIIDHWIAFILLGIIGLNMIKEATEEKESNVMVSHISYKDICILAIATSIDALAIGVSFAFLNVNIYSACCIIAITTFVLCVFAVFLGKKLGTLFQKYAELFGGSILILLGIKILIEHVFI